MTDTIEKVTLENAAEQLKAKIRMAFVELLPEEQWKAMVMAELKRFTVDTSEPKYRGSTEYIPVPSAFSKICSEVLTEYVKGEVKKVLVSPEWTNQWTPEGNQISEGIKTWLTQHSAQLVQATIQALAGSAAQNLVNGMRHQ